MSRSPLLKNQRILTNSFDKTLEGILNAFIATVNPTEGIVEEVDEEEDLVVTKFEKMD